MQCDMLLCKSDSELDDNLRRGDGDKHLIEFSSRESFKVHVRENDYFENKDEFDYSE
jgi:hypothetical protein